MACFACRSATTYLGSRPGAFAALSRAAAKSAAAKLRGLRVLSVRVDWPARAEACERCPMRVVVGNASYCGTPFLRKPARDSATDGCGCPTIAKAKDPKEHCPVNSRHYAATIMRGVCDCKWCQPNGIP